MVKEITGTGIGSITDISSSLGTKEAAPSGKSFGDFLTESLQKVNELQKESEAAVKSIADGQGASLQDAMIAVEKADVAFKLMMEVRQKILDAYKEITTMQA